MNKIQSACIFQTIIFSQNEASGLSKKDALKANQEEVARFIKTLEDLHVRHQVTDTTVKEDGSIVIKLRKQQDYVTDVKGYFKKQ